MGNQPVDDAGRREPGRPHGGPRSPTLSIGDGEIVMVLTQNVSRARELLGTVVSAGNEVPGQLTGTPRRRRRENAARPGRRAHVDPLLTVRGNLEVPLRRAGVRAATARQQIPAAADSLGLLDTLDTRAMTLTAKQRERVRLALEAIKPHALLLPESFAELPDEEIRWLRAKVLELRRLLGGRMVMVNETLDDIHLGADRIAVVNSEAVRQVGTPSHVYERPVDLYTAARFGSHSLLLAEGERSGQNLLTPIGRVRLPGNVADQVPGRQLLVGLRPGVLRADPGPGGTLRVPVRVTGTAAAGRPGEIDQDWSQSFALPQAALRAGLAARVAGVPLDDDARVGQYIQLTADPGDIMLFDASTGENILGDHVLADFGEVAAEAAPPVVITGGTAPSGGPPGSGPSGGPPGSGTPRSRPGLPGGPPAPPRVRRFLQCGHPPSVQRGSDLVISVQVTVQRGKGGRGFTTDPIPPEGAELLLVVYSDHFVARTDATISLKLPQKGDSTIAAFVLAAPVKTGRYRLLIRVFRGNAQLAEQPLTVEVSENPTAPSGEPAAWPLADAVPRPHVVRLIVTRTGKKYQYVLASDATSAPPISISRTVARSPDSQLRALVKRLNDMAAGKGYPPTQIREALRAQGQELWTDFIPEDLAARLASLDTDRSILWISTFGEIEKVPWEMLHPIEKIGGRDDFLSRIFPTVRSPAGSGELGDELMMRRAEVVLPDPGLVEATEEARAIRHILEGRAEVGDDICEKAKLSLVLASGEFSLLHMVGHNGRGKGAGLVLAAGQRLEPADLNELASSGGRWAAARPLVFLNACGTNQTQRTYANVTDWAHKCFSAGAGAFVGSLWDVRSASARAFATRFYRALFEDGQPLAVAAHLARDQAHQSGTDPTWLAYTVYGNPFARAVSAGTGVSQSAETSQHGPDQTES